ncbi:mechanosensitive ion channel domain-containing protein [Agrococcus jejuensis]|uniref:mechanosensitive ion channel domain-containing protein n=1 Tax=Agrococcus jejuensis TaxID=399736 RepID=UPI001C93092E|nr:mechanosensitive ion channel domain-containing protein [Agrococcus jejuensis]
MIDDVLAADWFGWAVALALGVPIVLVVLTEVVNHLQRRGHAAAKPLRLLRNWVVPVGALLALLAFAFQSPADQVWVRIVATVLGFLVILLVLSAFNVALFSHAEEGSWRQRIPTIFIEIARLVLVVVGLGLLFQWVWGADVGGLITALGVTSIVIGLALQNAVGGVISGLLLLFEQPFQIGDHLDAAGVSGRVVEVNWRASHIDTGSGIQIVPNSTLAGASFTNRSRPAGPHHASVDVVFSTDDPPHEVIALLVRVASSLPMLAPGETPSASYTGKGGFSVSLPVQGPGLVGAATSTFLGWLWYAARRQGFALDGDASDPIAEPGVLERAIADVAPSLFADEEGKALLAEHARLERWGVGETVQPAGVVPDTVRFVVDGRAQIVASHGAGLLELGIAERGAAIGQTALTREPAVAATVAQSVLTTLTVPLPTLDRLVASAPRLAQEMGRTIDATRQSMRDAVAASTGSSLPGSRS